MFRSLAPVLAAALLVVPAAAGAEPLELELSRLGAPDPGVHAALGGRVTPDANDLQAALDARKAFGLLSVETALAFSSAVLVPASTTGHSGFDVGFEAAYAGVHPTTFGAVSSSPTRGFVPHELFLPSVHVRKALPWSLELGGRVIYLAQSTAYAAQAEVKAALLEGDERWPEIALRGAWTQVLGQRDWNLGAGEAALLVSRRFGTGAVASLTPYLAARYAFVTASSGTIAFGPADPAASDPGLDRLRKAAAFPTLHAGFYRTTAGLRMAVAAATLSAEGTWFGGGRVSGKRDPTAGEYPSIPVKGSFSGAATLGLAF